MFLLLLILLLLSVLSSASWLYVAVICFRTCSLSREHGVNDAPTRQISTFYINISLFVLLMNQSIFNPTRTDKRAGAASGGRGEQHIFGAYPRTVPRHAPDDSTGHSRHGHVQPHGALRRRLSVRAEGGETKQGQTGGWTRAGARGERFICRCRRSARRGCGAAAATLACF